MTASPRTQGNVPPRLAEEASADPSISLRSLESFPWERCHSRVRPSTPPEDRRLPLLRTPTPPTPLHKPPPPPRDASGSLDYRHAVVAPSSSGASSVEAASHNAPAAEERADEARAEATGEVTDDLEQLASRFWAGVGVMMLSADELPRSSARSVGVSALSGHRLS